MAAQGGDEDHWRTPLADWLTRLGATPSDLSRAEAAGWLERDGPNDAMAYRRSNGAVPVRRGGRATLPRPGRGREAPILPLHGPTPDMKTWIEAPWAASSRPSRLIAIWWPKLASPALVAGRMVRPNPQFLSRSNR